MYKATERMLYDYRKTKAQIKDIDIEIQFLKDDLGNLNNISYDEKVSTSRSNTSTVENEITRNEEKEIKLKRLQLNKRAEIQRIENALAFLTEREQAIIKYRYFEQLSQSVIAERFYLSYSRISQIKKIAINKLQEIMFVKD